MRRVRGWLAGLLALGMVGGASGEILARGNHGGARLLLPANPGERVCWYAEQRYSEGAVLNLPEGALICAPQNEQESNGPLMWRTPEPGKEPQPAPKNRLRTGA
ncbi:DUF1496 domain-containing protein [Aeromonas simiae]|uniref:DUF1496 domain-containing protein n=1 Tax=Aeromonas simiae TaxID=218936 RepID=UPI000693615D|nr:DUF1496 domain-containing protein [Aeromonas simiae]MDO2948293.1 YnjH family protein [Aeromonas simiae]MDO2952970.1 YnjH family protein [Aeromonas simiae]MDO2955676.1 YnjH family protein [Aeromonas simiae]